MCEVGKAYNIYVIPDASSKEMMADDHHPLDASRFLQIGPRMQATYACVQRSDSDPFKQQKTFFLQQGTIDSIDVLLILLILLVVNLGVYPLLLLAQEAGQLPKGFLTSARCCYCSAGYGSS